NPNRVYNARLHSIIIEHLTDWNIKVGNEFVYNYPFGLYNQSHYAYDPFLINLPEPHSKLDTFALFRRKHSLLKCSFHHTTLRKHKMILSLKRHYRYSHPI